MLSSTNSASRLYRLVVLCARHATVPILLRLFGRRVDPGDVGARVREIISGMGVTFTKFGQHLATRFDLLPREIIAELQKLFEEAPRLPDSEVVRLIEAELQAPISELFDVGFDQHLAYVASASIAQVHKARTRNGDVVAVKLQRPGIRAAITADFRLLLAVGHIADRLRLFGEMSLSDTVSSFERATLNELDFRLEANVCERVGAQTCPGVSAPRVFWKLTTSRVLTMQFVEGQSLQHIIADLDAGRPAADIPGGGDLQAVIELLARESMTQVFLRGFFHGDPHPANFIVGPTGELNIVDFGVFGELLPEDRYSLGRFLEQLSYGNIVEAAEYYARVAPPSAWTDPRRYREELRETLRDWHRLACDPLADAAVQHPARTMGAVANVMRRNKVRMDPEHVMFWRCMMTLHSLALRLPVEFDQRKIFQAFFEGSRGERWLRACLTEVTGDGLVTEIPALYVKHATRRRGISGVQSQWLEQETPEAERQQTQRSRALLISLLAVATAVLFGWGLRLSS